MTRIVIAGAGLAAQRCIQTLRKRGFDGAITLVGDEGVLPYDRPPLSKEHLAGTAATGALTLRPESWYDDHAIERILDDAATGLAPGRRTLELASGATLAYDRLLVATGSAALPLPGTEGLANALALRTQSDAQRLATHLTAGARVAIVGAGFIGQEVAATARGLGLDVALIEAAPTPLHRILGPQLGQWFAELHRQEGVRVECNARIAGLRFTGDRVTAIELADRARIECDVLLAGIGVRPAAHWLGLTSLPAGPDGATAIEHVFAAGDVTGSGHWETAVAQGVAAAHGMLGLPAPEHPRPSFWSDQYGIRFQFAGDATEPDAIAIDGDPESRDFAAHFVRDGIVTAGLLAGRPRALPALRDQIDQPLHERNAA